MIARLRLYLFLLGLPAVCLSQNPVVDSLKNVLKGQQSDTDRVNTLVTLADKEWRIGDLDTAMKLSEEGLGLAEKKNFQRGIANACNVIGIVHWQQGRYPQGLASHFRALKIRETIKDRKGIATSYNSIGNIYWSQGNFSEALSYHQKALKIRTELNDLVGMAASNNNIGIIYIEKANYPEALKYFTRSVQVREKTGDKMGLATVYNNIGIIHENDKKYDEAYKYYNMALEIRKEVGDKNGIANSLSSIGNLYATQKKWKEARKYLTQGQAISLQVGNKRQIAVGYDRLAKLDSVDGDFRSAFEHHKLQVAYNDSMLNEANTKKSVEAAMNYEFEKKQAVAKADQEKKEALAEADKKRQKLILYAVSAFGIMFLFFAIFAYRSYLQKQRTNLVLEEKNVAIAEQKQLVEHKNLLITDSIEYARSIQEAILPHNDLLNEKLGEWFTFYKPKDVVSGDFYWAHPVKNKIFVATIDCTGHGVPGAFMSLMAFNMLENIILKKEFSQPSLVLDELNRQVISILKQQTESASAKYGMDITLIEIDRAKGKLEFAGAHNPLLIVRLKNSPFEGGQRAKQQGDAVVGAAALGADEIKANQTTIGMAREPFTNHTVQVNKGDMLYLFTDGFPDQKGGPQNKKYFASNFKELLISLSAKDCREQREMLEYTFERWRNGGEQTDDVLVMGIRI